MPPILRYGLLAAGVGVLIALVRQVGAETIADLLRRVGPAFAMVSLVYLVHVAVRAGALWRCVASLSYAEVLRVRLSGEAIEILTFTGPFLAEPAKGWLLTRRGLSGADAFGGVAIEYMLYTLTSAWMATIALWLLLAHAALPPPLRAPAIGILAGAIAISAGFAIAAVTGVGLIVPALRAVGAAAAAARIDPIERILVAFMHRQPRRLAEVLALEAVGQSLLVLEIFIVIRVLGFAFSPLQAFTVEGAAKFISIAFFFVPGQIGASEGVYTLLFASLGLPGAAGLTMMLCRRLRALIVAAVALVLASVLR